LVLTPHTPLPRRSDDARQHAREPCALAFPVFGP
jgi:hypothetical protein